MKTVQYKIKYHDGVSYYFATIYDQGFFYDMMMDFTQEGVRRMVEAKYPGIGNREYKVKLSELNLN